MIVWGVWGVEEFGFLGGIGGERGHWVMGKFGRKGGGMDPRLDPRHTDTDWVLKWVLVRIATFCCTQQPQIWIPEIL